MKLLSISILSIISILLATTAPQAETEVAGPVSGNWVVEDSPYLVVDDIDVRRGHALTIEAGVEVLFVDDLTFYIHGRLTASGEEDDSIRFRPFEDDDPWGGLRFIDATECQLSFCVITDGQRARGDGEPGNPERSGGNIFIAESEVTIEHSRISHGFAGGFGGGIAVWASNPIIRDSDISENESASQGGGINISRRSNARVENCLITGNTAHWGGGAINIEEDSDPTIDGCALIGNSAATGGGISLYGGDPIIRHTKFIGNHANIMGGGAYLRNEGNDPLLEWCDFIRNTAQGGEGALGGGVLLRFNTGAELRFCRFIENAARLGGAVYVQQGENQPPQADIHHSLFLRNVALAGGGIAISPGAGHTPLYLDHCTFLDNMANGEEITCAYIPEGSWMSFNSCIIWGPEQLLWHPGRALVEYCQISQQFDGQGNSTANPELFELDSTWALLRGDSPCVDSGDPNQPEDGDDSRNDRGWMYYPHNVSDYLESELVSTELHVGERVTETISLHSESDVPFFVTVADKWRFEEPDASVDLTDITDDSRIMCAAFTGDDFYVAGGNNGEEDKMIYVLDREFEMHNSYDQPGGGEEDGYIDLGFDGDATLYGGHEYIMEFAVDGEWGELYGGPDTIETYHGVTVDHTYPEQFLDFYLAGDEGVIIRTGSEFFEQDRWYIPVPVKSMAIRGNRRSLFIVTGPPTLDVLAEFDLETGKLTPLYTLSVGDDAPRIRGIEITHRWQDGRGTLIAVQQGPGDDEDRLLVVDLYTAWLAPVADLKLVFPGDEVSWDVLFAGDHVGEGEHRSPFYLPVNGWGVDGVLWAEVNALPSTVGGGVGALPAEFRIEAVYPNPFNSRARVSFHMPRPGVVSLGLFDLSGRMLSSQSGSFTVGSHFLTLDGNDLTSGQYILHLNGLNSGEVERIVLVR